MAEKELTKDELGCAMIIVLGILIGVVAFWYSYDDNPQPRYTPPAPVVEKQATNNELMKEIKLLRRKVEEE